MALIAAGGLLIPFNVLISFGSNTNNAYSAAANAGKTSSKSF